MNMEDVTMKYLVCYADTDAGGRVYHGRFFEISERARNIVLHKAGLSFSSLESEYGLLTLVHRVEAVFHAPAMLEDHLQVTTRITSWRASRSVWETNVNRDNLLLVRVTAQIVAVDIHTRRLTRFPDAVIEMVRPYVTASPHDTYPSAPIQSARMQGHDLHPAAVTGPAD
jgi:acyl-CoA thioester hydrolase